MTRSRQCCKMILLTEVTSLVSKLYQRKPLSSRTLPRSFFYPLNASRRSKSSTQDWQRRSNRRTILQLSCASPPAVHIPTGSASGRLPYQIQRPYYTIFDTTLQGFSQIEIASPGRVYGIAYCGFGPNMPSLRVLFFSVRVSLKKIKGCRFERRPFDHAPAVPGLGRDLPTSARLAELHCLRIAICNTLALLATIALSPIPG